MSLLPRKSGRDARRAFESGGYEFDRQNGSHMVLRQPQPPHRRLTVADHREIATGTLRALIREAGLTVEEFRKLLS